MITGVKQMRDRLVVVELDLLGVDQHEAHLVRARAQQHAGEHRVDRARLAGARRAGDEQVRHLREVGADRLAGDVLAEPHGQRRPVLGRLLEDVAESDDPPVQVGDLDADGLLAGDRREDADVGGGQRVGEVVLQLRHLGDLRARRQAQLVARDVRAGDGADHLRLHAEVPERLDQAARGLRLPGRVGARLLAGRARQQLARVGHVPDEVGVVGDDVAQAALRRQLGGIGARHAGDFLVEVGGVGGLELAVRHKRLCGVLLAGAVGLRRGTVPVEAVGALLRGALDVRRAHDQLVPLRVGRLHGRAAGEPVELEAFG